MMQSRRAFLSTALATAALGPMPLPTHAGQSGPSGLAEKIVAAFDRLPGKKALKLWAPAGSGVVEWSATLHQDVPLFCGSAFKVYVLAEFLRQVESGGAALEEQLVLDEDVYSPGAPVFNPPYLSGKVSARTVLEAMISHSDNTATDMALKRAGADRVRQFIASIGLHRTRIPTSTRQFFGYIVGDPDWRTITWSKLMEVLQKDPSKPNPIINDVETMVGSPHDFASFYSRALQGQFFQQQATLETFRAILSLADAIALSMPLGVNAFMKGGSIDFAAEHALCLAGGMWVPKRWVSFGMMINWTNGSPIAEVQQSFRETANKIFTWVRDGLGH
jgi:beta-lactamase class A